MNLNRTLLLIIPVFIFCIFSCKKSKTLVPEIKQYLHISHTRTSTNPLVDEVAEKIDYSCFDLLFLGGDLAHLTSEDETTMSYVDSVFDVGNENTLWSLGNHDYTDLARIQNYTNRTPYYAYSKNGITIIVLDTQDSLSNIIGQQKIFFDAVVDTIQFSSHLIVLHHKLIWMYGDNYLESLVSQTSNAEIGNCFYCINPNNFYTDIYPKLLDVQQRGVDVICIGGDIGFNAKSFEYKTAEGISFLASGISFGSTSNKALLFKHNLYKRELTWEFRPLSAF